MNRRLLYLLVIVIILVSFNKCNADEVADFQSEGQELLKRKQQYTRAIQLIDKRLIELNALIDYVQKAEVERLKIEARIKEVERQGTQEAERIGTE